MSKKSRGSKRKNRCKRGYPNAAAESKYIADSPKKRQQNAEIKQRKQNE